MAYRPNPFLERKLQPKPPPPKERASWFQLARDWTALVVSVASLVTALIALRNTLTGPRPFLAELTGDAITILRSDQFLSQSTAVPLRDEAGVSDDFPLLLVQTTLSNRAPPPNSVVVRAIDAEFVLSRQGQTLYRSPFEWYQLTESSASFDTALQADRIVFKSAAQIAPFDLPGGGSWSREVLLIPAETWANVDWRRFADQLEKNCAQPMSCKGELTLRVRLDSGVLLSGLCSIAMDQHVLDHVRGVQRRYFTSPTCLAANSFPATPPAGAEVHGP